MQSSCISSAIIALALFGCGSDHGGVGTSSSAETFNPPPPLDGYTRLVAATIHDVPPAGDITYCQYAMAPFDHDVDVLAMNGYQSKYGHHAAAFTYTPQAGEQPGASFPCMGTEFGASGTGDGGADAHSLSMGAFLGAVGGAGGGTPPVTLPEGVALRLKKGSGIMLNLHYLNTGEEAIDGNAVLDLKFADPDPSRKLAAMFINLNLGFDLPASTNTTSSIDCVAQSEVQIIMMSNHMHEFGTSASTEVHRAGGGAVDGLRADPTWSSDMSFNPTFARWPVDAPFLLHTGDTVRTTCNWNNTTAKAIQFPREMCVGVGFALTTGENPTAPICTNGTWVPQGL